MAPTGDWKILLIGGGTGTGKTELSRAVARRFDANVMEGDDLRWAIEAAVPHGSDPDLHLFVDADVWELPLEELLDRTERLSARICRAAEAVLVRHRTHEQRFILDAFWVLPAFAAQRTFNGVDLSGQVRSLFLYEDEASSIAGRRAAREPGRSGDAAAAARLAMFRAHGALMRRQAEALGLPVLASRPLETLEERALAVLDEVVP